MSLIFALSCFLGKIYIFRCIIILILRQKSPHVVKVSTVKKHKHIILNFSINIFKEMLNKYCLKPAPIVSPSWDSIVLYSSFLNDLLLRKDGTRSLEGLIRYCSSKCSIPLFYFEEIDRHRRLCITLVVFLRECFNGAKSFIVTPRDCYWPQIKRL